MFLRCRMNKIINLLRDNDFSAVKDSVLAKGNREALIALHNAGCIEPTIQEGNVVDIKLLDDYATYLVKREDVWSNRLYGFVAGVIATVVASALTGLLPPVLEAILRYIQ